MAARLNNGPPDDVGAGLVTDRVVYFPIRHHSPACARHLDRLVRERRPRAVLIEGPAAFTSLIPLMLHPGTRAPFAVYTSFAQPVEKSPGPASAGPTRQAAYYPFCDYSPELIALRSGAAVGASLRFIDLDHADQVLAAGELPTETAGPRTHSLLDESHLRRSRFLQRLAQRAGCRDHNDLWDHLFETRLDVSGPFSETVRFIQDVAAWCHYARADADPTLLATDGTHAREVAMAAAVRDELARGEGTIVVVTGGFHTVTLPGLVATGTVPPTSARARPVTGESFDCLVRYGFEQLDALNGYASGMPSPYYYDQLWRAAETDPAAAAAEVAARVLVDLGHRTRQRKLAVAVSPADEIAALAQARSLAAMRGHPGPTREDLLDGIRSCFVKGSMDAEGDVVLGLVRRLLGGTGVGEVPAEAGAPPIVADFRDAARRLRWHIEESIPRKSALDLYRKTAHRQASRLFHSLVFLEVPFAVLEAGPDFVRGAGLDRLFEHWTYRWVPQTESQLIEAGIHGATIEEAAAGRLARAADELEAVGRGRSASGAVTLLVQACRMGLQRHAAGLLDRIAVHIAEDPSLVSLAGALGQLVMLWESREPLEAHSLAGIPGLIGSAYGRACYLAHSLADTPADAADEVLEAIGVIRGLALSRAAGDTALDLGVLHGALEAALTKANCPPLLAGGLAGLLYADGRLSEPELLKRLGGSLHAASGEPGEQTAFLTGLLRTCRELAWRQPALVAAIETLLAGWTDEEFIERIPHLRMAFAELTPGETDRVAGVVADLHDGRSPDALHDSGVLESDIVAAARLDARVARSLRDDGLGSWIDGEPAATPAMEATS